MQLGWIDYSRQERDTIKELLKILGKPSSVDELGVGIVRVLHDMACLPAGSDEDETRKREWYDGIYGYLKEIGIEGL